MCGKPKNDEEYNHDSIQLVCSNTKTMSQICVAMLRDRGYINYDDLIVKYWPEFAANNKAHFLVSDLMRHETGLQNFNQTIDPDDLYTKNI